MDVGEKERKASKRQSAPCSSQGLGGQRRRDVDGLANGVVEDIWQGRPYEALEFGPDSRFYHSQHGPASG